MESKSVLHGKTSRLFMQVATTNIPGEMNSIRTEINMQSTSNDPLGIVHHNGLRVESHFQASENETDTDSDSGAFTGAHRRRKSNNEEGVRLSTPELIRHAFNIAVIKVRILRLALSKPVCSHALITDLANNDVILSATNNFAHLFLDSNRNNLSWTKLQWEFSLALIFF